MLTKWKSLERHWCSAKSSKKQCYKNQVKAKILNTQVRDLIWLGGKGNPMRCVQEIEFRPNSMHKLEAVKENETRKSPGNFEIQVDQLILTKKCSTRNCLRKWNKLYAQTRSCLRKWNKLYAQTRSCLRKWNKLYAQTRSCLRKWNKLYAQTRSCLRKWNA